MTTVHPETIPAHAGFHPPTAGGRASPLACGPADFRGFDRAGATLAPAASSPAARRHPGPVGAVAPVRVPPDRRVKGEERMLQERSQMAAIDIAHPGKGGHVHCPG